MADTPKRLVRYRGDPEAASNRFAAAGVTQSAGRIGLLEAGATPPIETPDLWVVPAAAPPHGFLEGLNSAEEMFVAAARLDLGDRKIREGEGLDWDEPGRLPPDPPRRI